MITKWSLAITIAMAQYTFIDIFQSAIERCNPILGILQNKHTAIIVNTVGDITVMNQTFGALLTVFFLF